VFYFTISMHVNSTACCLQLLQLKNAKPNGVAWIAARFDGHLPKQMRLGDGMEAGGFTNYPLQRDREYRVFVRAYTSDSVSNIYIYIYIYILKGLGNPMLNSIHLLNKLNMNNFS